MFSLHNSALSDKSSKHGVWKIVNRLQLEQRERLRSEDTSAASWVPADGQTDKVKSVYTPFDFVEAGV